MLNLLHYGLPRQSNQSRKIRQLSKKLKPNRKSGKNSGQKSNEKEMCFGWCHAVGC